MIIENGVVITYGETLGCPLRQTSLSPLVPQFAVAGDGNTGFEPNLRVNGPWQLYIYTLSVELASLRLSLIPAVGHRGSRVGRLKGKFGYRPIPTSFSYFILSFR